MIFVRLVFVVFKGGQKWEYNKLIPSLFTAVYRLTMELTWKA